MAANCSQRTLFSAFISGLALVATSATVQPAQAQEPGISATGKGITGGALLGAEFVLAVEAIAGVEPTWAYLVGGIAGAGLGGVGGYFIEQGDDPKPSYYLLAAGMALAIPTTVLVLQQTSYDPPDTYEEEPATEPAAPSETRTLGRAGKTRLAATPPKPAPRATASLVDIGDGAVRLSVPLVQLWPAYSATELHTYGLQQRTEVRLPVFRSTF